MSLLQSLLLISLQGTGGWLGGKGGGGFGFGERGDGNGGIEGKGGSSGLGAIGGDGGAGGIKKISTEKMSISCPKSSMINGCSVARATQGVWLSSSSVHASSSLTPDSISLSSKPPAATTPTG